MSSLLGHLQPAAMYVVGCTIVGRWEEEYFLFIKAHMADEPLFCGAITRFSEADRRRIEETIIAFVPYPFVYQ